MNTQRSKHNKLNNSFLKKVRGMEKTLTNYEYKNYHKTRCIGEIDGFFYKRTPRQNNAYLLETKHSSNPVTLDYGVEQLERAEKVFIPQYERQNHIKFNKVVKLLLNPYGVQCVGVSIR